MPTPPDFTNGTALEASSLNSIVLWKVAQTTFTASALPFINGCFSSTYENYRINMNLSTSAVTTVRFRFRFGTSTTESGAFYDRFGFQVLAGTVTNNSFAGGQSCPLVSTTSGGTEMAPVIIEMMSPNKAVKTVSVPRSWNSASGANEFLTLRMNNTTQYTGFEISVDSGTISGTIRVYGYRD